MADVWNPNTREYIRSVDRSAYGDPWIVIGKGAYPIDSLPACDPSLWELVEGAIVDGEPPEVVETVAERHLREQNQGVEIAASGVGFVKYTEEVRKLWQDLELFLRRCGGGVPGVTVWNAAGQQFNLSVADANAVIDEYTFKTGLQRMRQIAEVG